MKFNIILFASLLPTGFFAVCAGLSSPDIDPSGKVLCFGDSITHAGGYGWVEMLGEQHDYLVTVNAGRSGRKTSDRDELDPPLAANNDSDWVLFFLGVNDLKDGTPEMVGKCVENMEWMISRVRQKAPGARIVLMAPVDISLEGMNQINVDKKYNKNTRDSLYLMEKEYAELAKRTGVEFISLLHAVTPEHFHDGLHPDRKGQQEIADAVWLGMNKLVSEQGDLKGN